MFDQTFVLSQVKQSVIVNNKYKLTNKLILTILGNYETSGKSQKFIETQPTAQSSFQIENFFSTNKKSLKKEIELFHRALFHVKTRVCLEYFVHDYKLLHEIKKNLIFLFHELALEIYIYKNSKN